MFSITWLEENKDWVFSGAGVTAITALIAILSSFITYRINRRLRKKLTLKTNLTEYKLNLEHNQINDVDRTKDLTVTYKDIPYNNLCEFITIAENTGVVAIENQHILIKFPADCSLVDIVTEKSSQFIQIEQEEMRGPEALEYLYRLSRLEPSDKVALTYLIDTQATEKISCEPRGVDEIDYDYSGSGIIRDLYQELVLYFALFVLCGSLPFIGKVFQSLVILTAAPRIIEFLRDWRNAGNTGTEGPKYDFRGSQFAGGFAETVRGEQTGGKISNYDKDISESEAVL
ncbi:hypothetical protein Lepto7375DRAFT_3510 [Leptolyngbya sp. PCC 7375]|nr:hypothetical protein Lepto7375DRAFT_3510 [Leptolyngbya sp. PCC 7375]